MNKEIIEYVKKCPVFQLEKTTRIKNQKSKNHSGIWTSSPNKVSLWQRRGKLSASTWHELNNGRSNKRTIYLCNTNTSTRKGGRIITTHNPNSRKNPRYAHLPYIKLWLCIQVLGLDVPTDLTLIQKCKQIVDYKIYERNQPNIKLIDS